MRYLLGKIKDLGFDLVEASYIATPKNIQTSRFYDHVGLLLVEEGAGVRHYQIDLHQYNYTPSGFYKFQ